MVCRKMNDQFDFENKQTNYFRSKKCSGHANNILTTPHTSAILHNLHQTYSDIPNTKQQQIIVLMSKQQIIVVFGLKTCRTITLMNN